MGFPEHPQMEPSEADECPECGGTGEIYVAVGYEAQLPEECPRCEGGRYDTPRAQRDDEVERHYQNWKDQR